MSLAIKANEVARVLLSDGWHDVVDGSFNLDSYEFLDEDGGLLHGGGDYGVCASGFGFMEKGRDGRYLHGPLTSIQAIALEEL